MLNIPQYFRTGLYSILPLLETFALLELVVNLCTINLWMCLEMVVEWSDLIFMYTSGLFGFQYDYYVPLFTLNIRFRKVTVVLYIYIYSDEEINIA